MDWFLYDNGLRHKRVKEWETKLKAFDLNSVDLLLTRSTLKIGKIRSYALSAFDSPFCQEK